MRHREFNLSTWGGDLGLGERTTDPAHHIPHTTHFLCSAGHLEQSDLPTTRRTSITRIILYSILRLSLSRIISRCSILLLLLLLHLIPTILFRFLFLFTILRARLTALHIPLLVYYYRGSTLIRYSYISISHVHRSSAEPGA